MTKDEAKNELEKLRAKVEAQAKQIFPGRAVRLGYDVLNGSINPDRTADFWHWYLSINFGWDTAKLFEGEKVFTCTINPFTCGSFDPTDRDDEKAQYFMLVTETINHAYEIKGRLRDYFMKKEQLREQLDAED